MEGLTRLKRDRAPEEEEEWGQEELRPGEGEQMRRLAMAAYQKLRKERVLHPSVRTNPKHMAITMLLKERGSTERDGMKARLLRDYKLNTTVDLTKRDGAPTRGTARSDRQKDEVSKRQLTGAGKHPATAA